MGWTFYNSSGQRLSTASAINIANLDIDGATDIGAAIVDADLFIVDDGAGGTNRKTAASRIKTYIGTVPAQANQAAIEAETNEDTYIPPDLLVKHPGVAKVWCYWEQDDAHGLTASYNYTSVTDGGGVGDTDHVFDTDFSGTGYSVVTSSENNGTVCINTGQAAGTITTITGRLSDGAAIDHTINYMAGFGDQ